MGRKIMVKRLLRLVAMAIIWTLRSARNARVFDWRFVPWFKMVESVKELVFMWLNHRSCIMRTDWNLWCSFDMNI
ncbi:hypothetical protein Hdeb2414_s0002g00073641 [Helianthus debilis subsp. tardiflorus]